MIYDNIKSHKKAGGRGFTLSSEDTFLEKPQGVGGQDRFRVLELN